MTEPQKKYVVVLAHADGWGALSANKIIRHLHKKHPDIDVHLVVSTATKGEDGKIKTARKPLEAPRELKETNLLPFFDRIDEIYARVEKDDPLRGVPYGEAPEGGMTPEKCASVMDHGFRLGKISMLPYLTFNQLAKNFCAGHPEKAHYTTSGGFKGGKEAEAVVTQLEKQYGHGPEVLLSVDTMAILPEALLTNYQCFSCHPGPLDTLKVPGMQGTLRPLVNEVLYNSDGELMPDGFKLGVTEQLLRAEGKNPQACLKGTLFMQAPKLDEGPAIETALFPVDFAMSSYEARDGVYDVLTDLMIKHLPALLDTAKRKALVADAMVKKREIDALPHRELPPLGEEQLDTWMGKSVLDMSADDPAIVQSQLVDPAYFRGVMKGFYPGDDKEFDTAYDAHFGKTVQRIVAERAAHYGALEHFLRTPGSTFRRYDPKSGAELFAVRNDGEPPRTLLEKLAIAQGIDPTDDPDMYPAR